MILPTGQVLRGVCPGRWPSLTQLGRKTVGNSGKACFLEVDTWGVVPASVQTSPMIQSKHGHLPEDLPDWSPHLPEDRR